MKKCLFVFTALFISGVVTPVFAEPARDAAIDAQLLAPPSDSSATDGKAKVYEIHGKAVITSQGSPVERSLKVGDEISVGDSIYTEKGASLSISFDSQKKNAVQIPENSRATFTSIEPTDIKLENGAIFNVVNGLAQGSTWKVTTPSAVAAVRGTVFIVRYESASGQFYAATVDVADDGKISSIEVQSVTSDGGNASVGEGKEIVLKEGESPSQDQVQDLSPEAVAELQAFFEKVSSEPMGGGDTGAGESFDKDDSNAGSGDNNLPSIDPQDVPGNPLNQPENKKEDKHDYSPTNSQNNYQA